MLAVHRSAVIPATCSVDGSVLDPVLGLPPYLCIYVPHQGIHAVSIANINSGINVVLCAIT